MLPNPERSPAPSRSPMPAALAMDPPERLPRVERFELPPRPTQPVPSKHWPEQQASPRDHFHRDGKNQMLDSYKPGRRSPSPMPRGLPLVERMTERSRDRDIERGRDRRDSRERERHREKGSKHSYEGSPKSGMPYSPRTGGSYRRSPRANSPPTTSSRRQPRHNRAGDFSLPREPREKDREVDRRADMDRQYGSRRTSHSERRDRRREYDGRRDEFDRDGRDGRNHRGRDRDRDGRDPRERDRMRGQQRSGHRRGHDMPPGDFDRPPANHIRELSPDSSASESMRGQHSRRRTGPDRLARVMERPSEHDTFHRDDERERDRDRSPDGGDRPSSTRHKKKKKNKRRKDHGRNDYRERGRTRSLSRSPTFRLPRKGSPDRSPRGDHDRERHRQSHRERDRGRKRPRSISSSRSRSPVKEPRLYDSSKSAHSDVQLNGRGKHTETPSKRPEVIDKTLPGFKHSRSRSPKYQSAHTNASNSTATPLQGDRASGSRGSRISVKTGTVQVSLKQPTTQKGVSKVPAGWSAAYTPDSRKTGPLPTASTGASGIFNSKDQDSADRGKNSANSLTWQLSSALQAQGKGASPTSRGGRRNPLAGKSTTPLPPPPATPKPDPLPPGPTPAELEEFLARWRSLRSDTVLTSFRKRPKVEETYSSVGQVGEGTYAKVYKAQDKRTGVLVALKRIRMETEKDGFPITAMREIRLLTMLRHQNVVHLKDIAVNKGNVFMVFEYMDYDLTGLVGHPNVDLGLDQVKCLSKQLFAGLHYLHDFGILHRDIKGSNLLLNARGELKLADFGLARALGTAVNSGAPRWWHTLASNKELTNRVITLWYRPPELLMGSTDYGYEVDIWSAGCIVGELLHGKPLFQGQEEISQLDAIFNICGTPNLEDWPQMVDLQWYPMLAPKTVRPSKLRATIGDRPGSTMELVFSLLSLNPSKRPSAAKALAHPFFSEEPLPCDSLRLPRLSGDWHEFEMKSRRKKGTLAKELPSVMEKEKEDREDENAPSPALPSRHSKWDEQDFGVTADNWRPSKRQQLSLHGSKSLIMKHETSNAPSSTLSPLSQEPVTPATPFTPGDNSPKAPKPFTSKQSLDRVSAFGSHSPLQSSMIDSSIQSLNSAASISQRQTHNSSSKSPSLVPSKSHTTFGNVGKMGEPPKRRPIAVTKRPTGTTDQTSTSKLPPSIRMRKVVREGGAEASPVSPQRPTLEKSNRPSAIEGPSRAPEPSRRGPAQGFTSGSAPTSKGNAASSTAIKPQKAVAGSASKERPTYASVAKGSAHATIKSPNKEFESNAPMLQNAKKRKADEELGQGAHASKVPKVKEESLHRLNRIPVSAAKGKRRLVKASSNASSLVSSASDKPQSSESKVKMIKDTTVSTPVASPPRTQVTPDSSMTAASVPCANSGEQTEANESKVTQKPAESGIPISVGGARNVDSGGNRSTTDTPETGKANDNPVKASKPNSAQQKKPGPKKTVKTAPKKIENVSKEPSIRYGRRTRSSDIPSAEELAQIALATEASRLAMIDKPSSDMPEEPPKHATDAEAKTSAADGPATRKSGKRPAKRGQGRRKSAAKKGQKTKSETDTAASKETNGTLSSEDAASAGSSMKAAVDYVLTDTSHANNLGTVMNDRLVAEPEEQHGEAKVADEKSIVPSNISAQKSPQPRKSPPAALKFPRKRTRSSMTDLFDVAEESTVSPQLSISKKDNNETSTDSLIGSHSQPRTPAQAAEQVNVAKSLTSSENTGENIRKEPEEGKPQVDQKAQQPQFAVPEPVTSKAEVSDTSEARSPPQENIAPATKESRSHTPTKASSQASSAGPVTPSPIISRNSADHSISLSFASTPHRPPSSRKRRRSDCAPSSGGPTPGDMFSGGLSDLSDPPSDDSMDLSKPGKALEQGDLMERLGRLQKSDSPIIPAKKLRLMAALDASKDDSVLHTNGSDAVAPTQTKSSADSATP